MTDFAFNSSLDATTRNHRPAASATFRRQAGDRSSFTPPTSARRAATGTGATSRRSSSQRSTRRTLA